jgi:hypothetical protein
LPRQIEHIHAIARDKGYRIPWDLVFADDYTGFEFVGRPALEELRDEYKGYRNKRASAVVMEHIDRLSRNSDWHQGFLLDEMQTCRLTPFSGRIQARASNAWSPGAVSGRHGTVMERMREGTLKKAVGADNRQSGRAGLQVR